MNKNNSPHHIVLLIPEITKGMKSIGSKALLCIHKEYSILDYQIKYIKKYYGNIPIYILTGFDHDKILKKIKSYSNIHLHYNIDYEKNNQVDSIIKYINRFDPINFLLINNGVLLKEKLNLNNKISSVYMIPKYREGFSVGSSKLTNNRIQYLFYGLSEQWSECVYFNGLAVEKIRNLSQNIKTNNFFTFELINNLIDQNIYLESKYISNSKNIIKINTQEDIKKIKYFYDKNILTQY